MNNAEDRMRIYAQYRQTYGELTEAGKFRVGERIMFDNGAGQGEVLWKFHTPQGILTYVIDDNSGFPVEMQASEIEGRV